MWSKLLVGIQMGHPPPLHRTHTHTHTDTHAHTHTCTHIHSLALGYLITHQSQLPLCIWFFSDFMKFIVVSQLDFSVATLVFPHSCLCPFLSLPQYGYRYFSGRSQKMNSISLLFFYKVFQISEAFTHSNTLQIS